MGCQKYQIFREFCKVNPECGNILGNAFEFVSIEYARKQRTLNNSVLVDEVFDRIQGNVLLRHFRLVS